MPEPGYADKFRNISSPPAILSRLIPSDISWEPVLRRRMPAMLARTS